MPLATAHTAGEPSTLLGVVILVLALAGAGALLGRLRRLAGWQRPAPRWSLLGAVRARSAAARATAASTGSDPIPVAAPAGAPRPSAGPAPDAVASAASPLRQAPAEAEPPARAARARAERPGSPAAGKTRAAPPPRLDIGSRAGRAAMGGVRDGHSVERHIPSIG